MQSTAESKIDELGSGLAVQGTGQETYEREFMSQSNIDCSSKFRVLK